MTMNEQVTRNFNQDRLIARLTELFGGLALTLACVELYGVTAYAVARRTGEIGIRMAAGRGPSTDTRPRAARGIAAACSGPGDRDTGGAGGRAVAGKSALWGEELRSGDPGFGGRGFDGVRAGGGICAGAAGGFDRSDPGVAGG